MNWNRIGSVKQPDKSNPAHHAPLRPATRQLFLSCAPAVQIQVVESRGESPPHSALIRTPYPQRVLRDEFNLPLTGLHTRESTEKNFVIAQLLCN